MCHPSVFNQLSFFRSSRLLSFRTEFGSVGCLLTRCLESNFHVHLVSTQNVTLTFPKLSPSFRCFVCIPSVIKAPQKYLRHPTTPGAIADVPPETGTHHTPLADPPVAAPSVTSWAGSVHDLPWLSVEKLAKVQ